MEKLDQVYERKMITAALNLAKLDAVIGELNMATAISVRAIKVVNQGGHYLVVVTALVEGVPCVKYREIGTLPEMAVALLAMLTMEDWRSDKYAKLPQKA
jgi:hypothetical protein